MSEMLELSNQKSKIIMFNLLNALVDKADIMQEQTDNISRVMKIFQEKIIKDTVEIKTV